VRELERLAPGLDKASVRFQVVSEGERGLLGVGYAPARVIASLDLDDSVPAGEEAAGPLSSRVREILVEVVAGLELDAAVSVQEDDEAVTVTLTGGDLGPVIGRHGQTIDALQYLVNAIIIGATSTSRSSSTLPGTAPGGRRRSRRWPSGPPRACVRAARRCRSSR
jgi:predicted RNA-binding protein Jag